MTSESGSGATRRDMGPGGERDRPLPSSPCGLRRDKPAGGSNGVGAFAPSRGRKRSDDPDCRAEAGRRARQETGGGEKVSGTVFPKNGS
jgi:hypothetical protein